MLRVVASAAAGTFFALFPIVNPIGNLPIFLSMTSGYSDRKRRATAARVGLNVGAVLVTFLFVGRFLLHFFGISLPVLRVAGGLIVGHTSWMMVTGQPQLGTAEQTEAEAKEDVSLVPLAIPVLAGPGAIGVVVALAARVSHWSAYPGYVAGIAATGLVVSGVLAMGETAASRLGANGVGVVNRVFGFLILAIAVHLIADGVLAIARSP